MASCRRQETLSARRQVGELHALLNAGSAGKACMGEGSGFAAVEAKL